MGDAATVEQFEMPWVAEIPKREAKQVTKALERYKDFLAKSAEVGGVLPVPLAAEILNVGRQRVYDLIDSGNLKTLRIDGIRTVFVTSNSLADYAHTERKAGRPIKLKSPGIGSHFRTAIDTMIDGK